MKKILILLTLLSFNVFATPVNINKADAKTLSESLKGIGMKRAKAIVAYRSKNGPFKSIDDLRNVKGIGDKIVKGIASDTGLSKSKRKKSSVNKPKKAKKKVEKKAKKLSKKDKKTKQSKKVDKKAKKKKSSKKSKKKKSK